ncbi:MAG: hypothetical protein ACR2OZ_08045 [Verrucomicrobiales bacterium]
MKTTYALVICLAATLAACDSPEKNRQERAAENTADTLENRAEAVRKDSERKADAIESTKQGTDKLNPATPADDAARAVRKDGENKADALENKADAVRKQN